MTEVRTIDAEPLGEYVVATLEQALAKANAGEVSSVAVAVVYRDGSTGQAWSEPPSISALIGSSARLVYRLNQALDD